MVILDYDDAMRVWRDNRILLFKCRAANASVDSHVSTPHAIKSGSDCAQPTTFRAAGDALQLLLSVSLKIKWNSPHSFKFEILIYVMIMLDGAYALA